MLGRGDAYKAAVLQWLAVLSLLFLYVDLPVIRIDSWSIRGNDTSIVIPFPNSADTAAVFFYSVGLFLLFLYTVWLTWATLFNDYSEMVSGGVVYLGWIWSTLTCLYVSVLSTECSTYQPTSFVNNTGLILDYRTIENLNPVPVAGASLGLSQPHLYTWASDTSDQYILPGIIIFAVGMLLWFVWTIFLAVDAYEVEWHNWTWFHGFFTGVTCWAGDLKERSDAEVHYALFFTAMIFLCVSMILLDTHQLFYITDGQPKWAYENDVSRTSIAFLAMGGTAALLGFFFNWVSFYDGRVGESGGGVGA